MAKLKNIEEVWSKLKSNLPSYIKISDIEKFNNMKMIDLVIPKSRVRKFPDGVSNEDLNFVLSWDYGLVIYQEESDNNEDGIIDEKHLIDYFKKYINMKNTKVNEGAITSIGLIQHIDKDYVTTLSDEGIKNAIQMIDTDLKIASQSIDVNSQKFYRDASDKFEILTTEFRKRGLPLREAFSILNKKHGDCVDDIVKLIVKHGQYINQKDMVECLEDIIQQLKTMKSYKQFSDYYFKEI